jgi:uncharacterized protein (TIGR02596 family)
MDCTTMTSGPTPDHPGQRRNHGWKIVRRGFTLIELLLVITIIGILLALATPFLVDSISSSRLTMAGTSLAHRLSLAQQEATSRNIPVEVRFVSYEHEGVKQIRAYQIFVQNRGETSLQPTWEPLGNPEYLGDGEVVIVQGALSPIFEGGGQKVPSTMEPFSSTKKDPVYYSIRFAPDGSTQLNRPLASCYFTLALEARLASTGAGGAPPANYCTIQLDPVTGRSRTYRP